MPKPAFVLDPNRMMPQAGFAWTVELPPGFGPGDTEQQPQCSTLLLFEGDQPLGPPHSIHEVIDRYGAGAYSHWHNTLYFSSSNNSDPRGNGCQYQVFRDWEPGLPRFESDGGAEPAFYGSLVRASIGWDDVLLAILFINRLGIHIRPGAQILDFGCGSGQHTYHMRDFGFDCHGFDVYDSVQYRSEEDHKLFGFAQAMPGDGDMRINSSLYSIPFPDNMFDVIFSFSVLEHVMDLDAAMRECARVLKPSGIVVHCYPGRCQLVEPHICVPLASFFAPAWWVRLWSRLGARDEHSATRTWQEAAQAALQYIEIGLSYRSRRQILSIARRYFGSAKLYSSRRLYAETSTWQRTKAIARAFFDPQPFRALGQTVLLQALVCERAMHGR